MFTLNVNSGSGDGDYVEGTQVTITADTAPAGQTFDVWTGDTAVLADPSQSSTTVTMPATAVTLTATYKSVAPVVFTLNVNSGSGDGDYVEGAQITVTADTAPAGQTFDVWTGDTIVLADPTQASTTVTMPATAVTLMATYKTVTQTDGTDLRINLSSNKSQLAVGQTIEFTFVTVNDGPENATGVETVMLLPFDAEWVWGSSGCSLNQQAGEIVCDIGAIGEGNQRTRQVGLRAQESWDTTVEMSVGGDQNDSDLSNNTASVELSVSSDADMRVTITKSYPSGNPKVGRVANYRIRTYNDGPASAPDAVMIFELPAEGELYSKPSSCSLNQYEEVECNFGNLNSGQYRTRTIGVRMLEAGTNMAQASVESDAADADMSNNTASLEVMVVP